MEETDKSNEQARSAMNKQQPTIGRIVRYFGIDNPRGANDTPKAFPAIITHVWSDECVNLHVFTDGSYGITAPGGYTPTSVTRGDELGQWEWPPIG